MTVALIAGCLHVDNRSRVAAVLHKTPLIDGHNDIAWSYRKRVQNHLHQLDFSADLTLLDKPTQTDLRRMRKGMMGGQFWSVYVPISQYAGDPGDPQLVIEQIDLVKRLVQHYSDTLEMAYTPADVLRIHRHGKIASMIGIEGGHAIHNSLAMLRQLFALGARYMTLTHSKSLLWVDSATGEPRHNGLTPFGRAVVREMNRLGMLVDLSHVSPDTMRDLLGFSEAPVIFSHSSAYAVTHHVRNVPDDVLRLIAKNNGIVMVTFYPSYVSEDLRLYVERMKAEAERFKVAHTDQEVQQMITAWRQSNPAPRPTIDQVADHIDHLRKIAGIDHIGLGGDYDGMPPGPIGLEDVSKYPDLLEKLLARGYSDEDIAKIAGKNILRVWANAEQVARRLQNESEASDELIEELDSPVF